MKNLLYLMMCIPLMTSAQEGNSGIKFEHGLSWQQVKTKAKAENKYIFMDVFTTWCVPCKQMDKEVYPNDTVGRFMNEKFISVKVQMDSTGKDNEQVKKWYDDARAIEQEYKIEGYPSFLFFNPYGTLIYKELGYKDVSAFIKLVTMALDTQNIRYYSFLEDYKKGKKNYEDMYDLAMFTKNTLGNDTLAKQIAEDYINYVDKRELFSKEKILFIVDVARKGKLADSLFKEYNDNYLNKLSEEEFCTRENLRFIERFNHLITSKDKIFQLSYSKPEKIDSAINFKDAANYYVHYTIMNEEITSRLFKGGMGGIAIFKNPDWSGITALIKKKYPKVDSKKLLLNYQRGYYSQLKDWRQWSKYQDEIIKSYRVKPAGPELFSELNDLGAWYAFLNCTDQKVLVKALEWIEVAIKLGELDPKANVMYFLDTRANVLYKLGRVKEAIPQQEKAIKRALAVSKQEGVNLQSLMNTVNDYRKVLEKMKKGEPTYLDEGAVWDAKSLKRISTGKKK